MSGPSLGEVVGEVAGEPSTGCPRRRKTTIITFGAALVLAIVIALVVGMLPYRKLSDAPAAISVGPGQPVVVDGFSYQLDSFSVARSLPADDADEPPVSGPKGSVLVLVVYLQTPVSPTADLRYHRCDPTLATADASWEEDDDFTTLIRRPEAQSCYGTDDDPLHLNQSKPIGVSFVVPAAVSRRVTFRLALGEYGKQVVEMHR